MMKKFLSICIILTAFIGVNRITTPKAHAQIVDVQQFVKEFAIDTLTTILSDRILDKLVNDALNWANGGFDGEPGFINNWDGFLEGVGNDIYSNTLTYATSAASQAFNEASSSFNNGVNDALNNTGAGDPVDPAAEAENNFNIFNSGAVDLPRELTQTIANFALDQTNTQKLDQLIAGEGETLTRLLGSKAQVDSFLDGNLQAGGWAGYIALGDPHNTTAGREALVTNEIATKIVKEQEKKLQDLQTPQKYQNKTNCQEYKKDPEGNETNECIREIIKTPASQVSQKVDAGLQKEDERLKLGKELSDILAAAVGKLATGLLQQGLNALGGAISNKGGDALADITGGDPLANTYQNQYDILGISSLPTEESSSSGSGGVIPEESDPNIVDLNSTSLINDSSIPSVEELEIILNLEGDFDRRYNQTKDFIDQKQEIIEEMRKGFPDVQELDRCVPGPDFGWEKRFTDLIDIEGNGYGGKFEDPEKDGDADGNNTEGDKYTSPKINAQTNKIAFNLAKAMSKDQRINIPGAINMLALAHSYLKAGNDGITSVKDSVKDKKDAMVIMSQLRGIILQDFENFKAEARDNDEVNSDATWNTFPIFEADWNKLSDTEKIALLELKPQAPVGTAVGDNLGAQETITIENYLLEKGAGSSAMVLNELNGLTPEEFYFNNREKARDVVLAYAWHEIWKEGMMTKEPAPVLGTNDISLSGKEQRDNILRFFFTIKNKLANGQNVVDAELEHQAVIDNNLRLENYLHDCRQFRAYMYGSEWYNPPKISATGAYGKNISIGIGNVEFKAHADIYNYLTEQRVIQNDDDPNTESDFKTDIMTSLSSIENSMVGLPSWEIKAYYDANYGHKPLETLEGYPLSFQNDPDAAPGAGAPSAYSVDRVLNRDMVSVNGGSKNRRVLGNTGTLFCWSEGDYSLHKKGKANTASDVISECLKPWYYTKDVEYKVIFSDIQN